VQQQTEVPEGAPWFRRVETEHLSVPCLFIEHEHPRATLLYLHGNAMAISEMQPLARAFSSALSCHVVAPEIPGMQYDWGRTAFKGSSVTFPVCFVFFTLSDGVAREASEQGYYEAALGAFDWARKTVRNLICFFVSQMSSFSFPNCLSLCSDSPSAQDQLGSSICHFPFFFFFSLSEVCVRREAAGLVLQSPLLSAVRVAFPSLFTLPLTDIFVSIAKASKQKKFFFFF
jgi:hypothetical protein